MRVRKAEREDFSVCCEILEAARKNIAELGIDQWQNGTPSSEDLKNDINNGDLYAAENEGEILGILYIGFCGEPTYDRIYGGEWLNSEPFCVIHRVALKSEARGKGVFSFLISFARKLAKSEGFHSLRIDTHRDNVKMKSALKKNGFHYCGIIYLENGEERIVFQQNI